MLKRASIGPVMPALPSKASRQTNEQTDKKDIVFAGNCTPG